MTMFASIVRRNQALAKCECGAAAIEFAFVGGFLSLAILNSADLALYLYDRIQVENATEMGAQAIWHACDFKHLPASTKCTGYSTAATSAVQSTTLGNRITLQTGYPAEGYYCVNASNVLQYMSDTSSKPLDCTAAGTPILLPGDYVQVKTTFTYAPLFPGLTVTTALPASITSTSMMRRG